MTKKTISQMRDEVAEMIGYTKSENPSAYTDDDCDVWLDDDGVPVYDHEKNTHTHPVPETIAGISDLWPVGWNLKKVTVNGDSVFLQSENTNGCRVSIRIKDLDENNQAERMVPEHYLVLLHSVLYAERHT